MKYTTTGVLLFWPAILYAMNDDVIEVIQYYYNR